MKSTKFGNIHSARDLGLIQKSVKIGPAVPRINIIDVPGRNGGVDMTGALGVDMTYQDRTIEWTFGLYPGLDWATVRREVENKLNGRRFDIELEEEPGWLYSGRVSVTSYETDSILHTITVSAICDPYKLQPADTVMTFNLTAADRIYGVDFGSMPVCPVFDSTANFTLFVGNQVYTAGSGRHEWPDMIMSGMQTLTVKGAGALNMTWRKGSL